MRIGGVSLGVIALLWGFLQAPFDHLHPGEELEHQPTSAPVHLHVHERFAGHGPFIAPHTADDDEIDVQWNAASSANVVLVCPDAELAERVRVPAPSFASNAVLMPRHRGHDPPESSPRIPRAPPA